MKNNQHNQQSDRRQAVIDLLQALIQKPSVTPDDAGCQHMIAERLGALGFSINWLSTDTVTNLWARMGDQFPLVCFAGHTDVVPVGHADDWIHDPFSGTIDHDRCYGRGASDMKGGVAAFIVAIEHFVNTFPDFKGSIAVLLTSDEEGLGVDGTAKVVDWLKVGNENIDYCIVAEPTCETAFGDMIKHGRRGSIDGKFRLMGIQGHVAYAHLAKNPIIDVAPLITQWANQVWDHGNDDFPPTTFQISNIKGGVGANNVIPPSVTLSFNFRHSPESSLESLSAQMIQDLDAVNAPYQFNWLAPAKPYWNPVGSLARLLAESIVEHTGVRPEFSTGGGTSDGRFLIDISDQLLEFGLKNETIHQVNEYANLTDVTQLTRIFYQLLQKLLNQ